MAATEQVIIEFIADSAGLAPALDKLEALGVIDQKTAASFRQTNVELQKRGQQLASVASNTSKLVGESTKVKKSITDLDGAVKNFTKDFVQGFQQGVIDELKKAGVSAKEFDAALSASTKEGIQGAVTLKAELRQITEQLARMKVSGEDATNPEQYKKLTEQAGKLRDAIGDVTAEINKTASDTRKLDTVIEFAQGIAASFAIAQGATALFGDENKDLQEVLVKVTSAMAVLNALQVVGNLLQKESNVIRAISNTQLRLQVIQTNLQTAAQSKNVVVSGAANVAMKILNATMKANPAFLLVGAFAALAGALVLFSGKTKQAADETALLNIELERQNDLLNKNVSSIDFQTKLAIADAKKRGASEKEVNDITIIGLQKTESEYRKSIQRRISTANELFPELGGIVVKNEKEAANGLRRIQILEAQLGDNISKSFKERLEQGKELLKNVISDFQNLAKTTGEIKLTNTEFDADQAEKLRQKQKEADEKRKRDLEKAIEDEKRLRRKGFEDFVASVDVQLVTVKKGTEEELDLQKQRLRAVLQLELDNEDLTTNQRLLLVKKYFAEREQLEADFFKDRSQKELENSISILNAELTQLNLSAAERENLTITLLNKQRDLELAAVGDNKAKQKEINAKFDREIADQSVAIFKSALDEQQRLLKAQNAPLVRADTKLADNPNADIEDRIGAIDRLLNRELESIQKRKEANAKLVGENKISQKEAAITAAELADEEAQAVENAEEKKRNAYQQTADKKKELEDAIFEITIQTAQETVEIVSQFFQQQTEAALINIEGKKKDVEQLRQAGAITEKESVARMKRLEQEEKRIRRQQAVRDRDIAIFQAVINTANAVVKAYATTGPIAGAVLAAIVGAIGAAQIALIASRPIPKFFKGKKDSYEGLGEVGERGTELIQSDGKLWVAEKPTVVWLNKKDIVYNPTETKKLLEKPLPMVSKKVMNVSNNSMNNHFSIDYKKIGEEVGKHVTNQHLEITEKGIRELSKKGNSWTEYLDKRRSF